MSQADANSNDGDMEKLTTTGTGCYKNFDHQMKYLDVDDYRTHGARGIEGVKGRSVSTHFFN